MSSVPPESESELEPSSDDPPPTCCCDECGGECDTEECKEACEDASSNPVQYASGRLRLKFEDLSAKSFGFEFSHHRSYGNLEADLYGMNGYGWQNSFLPQFEGGPVAFLSFSPTRVYHFFRDAEGNYDARFFFRDLINLRYDYLNHRYFLFTPGGATHIFGAVNETGAVWGIVGVITADGGTVDFTRDTGPARNILSVTKTVEGVESGLYYDYISGSLLATTVTLRLKGADVRRASYTYYAGGGPGGSNGDLKTATIEKWDAPTASWVPLKSSFHRYYVEGEAHGAAHLLKYVLEPEACARFAKAYPELSLESATDAQLAEFADYYFEYDDRGRVARETVRGGGYTYLYSYAGNPNWNAEPSSSSLSTEDSSEDWHDGAAKIYNSWYTRTNVLRPDGSEEIVYSNPFGQPMLKTLRAGEAEWSTAFRYDDQGRRLLEANPSAVAAYDERVRHLFTLAPNSGLITLTEYYDGGSFDAAPGRRKARRVCEGENGTPVLLQEWKYLTLFLPPQSYYFPKEETIYYGPAGSIAEAAVTAYDYTFHTDLPAMESRLTTLPAVSTEENGSDVANTVSETFDVFGNRLTRTDEVGSLNEWTWDTALTAPTQFIRSGGDLYLVTAYEVDDIGRTIMEIGPVHIVSGLLPIRRATSTLYVDTDFEVRSAVGYLSHGLHLLSPMRITRVDRADRVVEEITATLAEGGSLTDALTQEQYCRWSLAEYDNQARLLRRRVYHKIPAVGPGEVGFNFGEARYSHDSLGRVVAERAADGTITRRVLDPRGLNLQTWIGTDDTGATPAAPSSSGAGDNNMVLVQAREYDQGRDGGDGLMTQTRDCVSDEEARLAAFTYNFRGQQIEARLELGRREVYTVDNLGRITDTTVWSDEGNAALRVAANGTRFDALGRVYQTIRYAVDPVTGAIGTSYSSNTWYDPVGRVAKQKNAEGPGFEKFAYDGVGRLQFRYAGYNLAAASYAEAMSVADDYIMEQTDSAYDAASNGIEEIRRERFHDTTGTGPLNGPDGDAPLSRNLYTMFYPDALGRTVAKAEYGTNGGTAPTRPVAAPASSDTILVTGYSFNARGELFVTSDPGGIATLLEFDDAGRLVREVANPNNAEWGPGFNRTTEYAYTLGHNLAILIARNSSTGDQITRWHYGTTLAESGIASNALVRAKVFPDSDDAGPANDGPDTVYDRVEYGYNRLSEVVRQRDQNGTVHAYGYDGLGRLAYDAVAQLGVGIDGAVRRISNGYDRAGRLESVTSWGDAAANAGSIVNQVWRQYDALGNLTAEYQSHAGPVQSGSTPRVQYNYSANPDQPGRRLAVIYPDGRPIRYDYASGSADDALGRITAIRDGSDADAALAQYTRRGLAATVRIEYANAGAPTPVTLTYIKQDGEPNGDGGDQYTGLDRFNRIVDIRWLRLGTTDHLDRFQYGFNRNSLRLWRKNVVAETDWDELYEYDELRQLKGCQRGTLNADRTGLESHIFSEAFEFDSLGNWSFSVTAVEVQRRTHNRANEISSVNESSRPVGYDRAGNMLAMPEVGIPTNWEELTWDAWNRLACIQRQGVSVGRYEYDGLTRRTVKIAIIGEDTVEIRHHYYSDQWQVLEERLGEQPEIGSADRQFIWGLRYADDLILRDRDNAGEPERLYALHDQWHVTALVDAGGLVQERYAYWSYGADQVLDSMFLARDASLYSWNIRYGAYSLDLESRLYQVRHRYFHTGLGRWASRDPFPAVTHNDSPGFSWRNSAPILADLAQIGSRFGNVVIDVNTEAEVDFANLYAYASNSPINAVDPKGLRIEPPANEPNGGPCGDPPIGITATIPCPLGLQLLCISQCQAKRACNYGFCITYVWPVNLRQVCVRIICTCLFKMGR